MIGFSYTRNLAYSFNDLAPYYVRSGFGLSGRRQLIDRWDVTAAARFYHHHYATFLPVLIDPNTLDEDFTEGEIGIGYQAGPATRAQFTVAYADRRSIQQLTFRSYNAVRVGGSIVYAF
jgi:hypothetical protein